MFIDQHNIRNKGGKTTEGNERCPWQKPVEMNIVFIVLFNVYPSIFFFLFISFNTNIEIHANVIFFTQTVTFDAGLCIFMYHSCTSLLARCAALYSQFYQLFICINCRLETFLFAWIILLHTLCTIVQMSRPFTWFTSTRPCHSLMRMNEVCLNMITGLFFGWK